MPTSEEDAGSGQKSEDELKHETLSFQHSWNVASEGNNPESQVADSREERFVTTHRQLAKRRLLAHAYDFIFLNPITNGRFLPPYMYLFTLPNTQITETNSFAALVAGTSAFQATSKATIGNFGTTIKNFGSVGPIDQGLKNPHVQQWNLTVQREISHVRLVRASYVGTKGNYLQRARPINTIAPGIFTPPQTAAQEADMQSKGVFNQVFAGLNAPLTASS